MPELPENHEEFEASLDRLLANIKTPPSEEASLPYHIKHMVDQFTEAEWSKSQALYIIMAIITQNPGHPPTA